MTGDDCVFCRIAQGNAPCAKVYEDEEVLAFLAIGPIKPGHTLVIPKSHYKNLLETPDKLAQSVHKALQAIGRAVMSATGAQGFNVLQNNNPAAEQTIFHVHWHVIPRHDGDGVTNWVEGRYANQEEMRDLAQQIASFVQA